MPPLSALKRFRAFSSVRSSRWKSAIGKGLGSPCLYTPMKPPKEKKRSPKLSIVLTSFLPASALAVVLLACPTLGKLTDHLIIKSQAWQIRTFRTSIYSSKSILFGFQQTSKRTVTKQVWQFDQHQHPAKSSKHSWILLTDSNSPKAPSPRHLCHKVGSKVAATNPCLASSKALFLSRTNAPDKRVVCGMWQESSK